MALKKQAKTLNPRMEGTLLRYAESGKHAARNRVMVLLSVKAGLRAKEIALITWAMLTDAEGVVAEELALEDKASKGDSGRIVPLHRDLRQALITLQAERNRPGSDGVPGRHLAQPHMTVIYSEQRLSMSAGSVTCWFWKAYHALGLQGCSSHSGRRTFITRGAQKITEAGGSLRDIQLLAGHKSLSTTQGYIESSSDAKRKVVDLI